MSSLFQSGVTFVPDAVLQGTSISRSHWYNPAFAQWSALECAVCRVPDWDRSGRRMRRGDAEGGMITRLRCRTSELVA